jgi:molecular chaperone GrpE
MAHNDTVKININRAKNAEEDGNMSEDMESPADAQPDDVPPDPGAELEKAREEAREARDKYLRLYAEFENYKKRAGREIEEFRKYANESLITALLPVVDNLERAVASAKDESCTGEPLVQGVEMTLSEIIKILKNFQVDQIESLGKTFDPNFHQAMLQEISEEHPDNTILQELQKGYTLHNRLLRPAMVVVSKTTDK